MSNKMTLNVRGSYYNMVDEFYNPSLELGAGRPGRLLADAVVHRRSTTAATSYYPALDVTTGTGTATTNRLGRQGREWYQHPDAWTASARMNYYMGNHNMKWGGEMRSYFGEAARFEPINLVFNSALTANSSDTPDVTGSGNQWATFMLGALDSQTSARLVPLQEPDLKSYAAYIQDDWNVNDRLTLNLGLRWEYEPGATDPLNRISQRLDLTSPIPEMQATPPPIPAQASQLMASKGYAYSYTGEWVFASESRSLCVEHVGAELHAASRRGLPPRRQVGGARRLRAVPDADHQRARHARRFRQPVHRLRADHHDAGPGQRRAAADAGRSVPGQQPGDRTLRPGLRPLHRPRRRRQPRSVPAAPAGQRSLQLLVPARGVGQDRRRGELLPQSRLARAVRHQPQHGRPGVPLRAEDRCSTRR